MRPLYVDGVTDSDTANGSAEKECCGCIKGRGLIVVAESEE